jgi:predicted glycosyltransferase
MTSRSRIAIYSQDSLGLGHLRRSTLIGGALLNTRKDASVLVFADSPVAPFFKLPDHMDHVKLPSIRKVSAGCWEATRLQIDDKELVRLRASMLCNALLNFHPDLLLVDHMPGGAQGELLPAIKALKQSQPKCSVVLGLRDILDAPEVTQRVWESEGAYDALRCYYDRVLIYGSKEIYSTCSQYRLPTPEFGTHYCGYVVKQDPIRQAAEVRQSARLPAKRPFVFVSAGGGGDGQALMRTYVQAIRSLGPHVEFATLMAVGVNAPPAFERELAAEARGLPIRIVPYVDDSLSCIAAADLVVCMAGYNTLSEVLYLKKKALVVPRSGPSAEQTMRAGLLSLRGLIDVLKPTELSPDIMANRLVQNLDADDYTRRNGCLPMDGATQAADRLAELLPGEANVAQAA